MLTHPFFHTPTEPSKARHLSFTVLSLALTTLHAVARPAFHTPTQQELTTFCCFSMATITTTTLMRPEPLSVVVPYLYSSNHYVRNSNRGHRSETRFKAIISDLEK
jgi:hypothetical protein